MFAPDARYTGTVTRGILTASQKGTPGFELLIECGEDGAMLHTIWITTKNIERVIRDFAVFGVEHESLGSERFLKEELPELVVGKEVTFGTKLEVYNGQPKVKVAWIGKPSGEATPEVVASVAEMFRSAAKVSSGEFDDSEIPF